MGEKCDVINSSFIVFLGPSLIDQGPLSKIRNQILAQRRKNEMKVFDYFSDIWVSSKISGAPKKCAIFERVETFLEPKKFDIWASWEFFAMPNKKCDIWASWKNFFLKKVRYLNELKNLRHFLCVVLLISSTGLRKFDVFNWQEQG